MIFLAMLIMGSVIGFVGAGGAGVTIALLTLAFDVPIHTAVAVALAAMTFTMLSGAYSHFREREVEVSTGLAMGIGGVMGAFIGANVSNLMPAAFLKTMTAIMLCASAALLYTKVYQAEWLNRHFHPRQELLTGAPLYRKGILAGLVNGFLSGAFGIGAAAFIRDPPEIHRHLHDDHPAHVSLRRNRLLLHRSSGHDDFPPNPRRPGHRSLVRSQVHPPGPPAFVEICHCSYADNRWIVFVADVTNEKSPLRGFFIAIFFTCPSPPYTPPHTWLAAPAGSAPWRPIGRWLWLLPWVPRSRWASGAACLR